MVAGLCLFALKSMGLLMSGGYVVSGVAPATAQNANTAVPSQAEEDSAAAPTDNANENPTKTPQDAENKEQEPTDTASADAAGAEQGKPNTANADGSAKDVTAESPKAQLAVLSPAFAEAQINGQARASNEQGFGRVVINFEKLPKFKQELASGIFILSFDEAVGQLADMHEAVLMYADVYKRAEIGDIGDDSGKRHPWLQVLDVTLLLRYLVYSLSFLILIPMHLFL